MDRYVLSAVLAATVTLGCAQLDLLLREPGEQIVTMPTLVAAQYKCSKRRLPFLKLEKSQLEPDRMPPGSRINHRFTYVMCPSKLSEVIEGTLYTQIHYKGKAVYTKKIRREMLPGRWVVDAFIQLPDQAAPGVYALETRFESRKGRFVVHKDFIVEKR